ncbi:MAG: patatin-like phospholipase family protein [Polyangiaceae bacterium]|nr:patatin-like phospholipase family protein [Polyangiaceae bacterium]
MTRSKIALCLPGGGATGAMYQIGALAALEHAIEGFDATALDLYVGASSGASVAATLAAGRPIERMYRAFLDPADAYFPLERRHVLQTDGAEWRRTVTTALGALAHGARSFVGRPPLSPAELWEELDRFNDSLPAGVLSLEAYERFLDGFFVRRGIPQAFSKLPRPLRILAHDLDSGEKALFGAPGLEHVPITRACIASMAVPPFFSPVRIGDRHYIDAGAAQVSMLELAIDAGAEVVVVVNPMVPVNVSRVPTGHGRRSSVRDKGLLWVANQAIRISLHTLLREAVARVTRGGRAEVLLLEPDAADGILFMYSPASFAARRNLLESGYKTTRARVARLLEEQAPAVTRAGFVPRARESQPRSHPPGAGG